MKAKYVILSDRYKFSKWPDETSRTVYDAIIEKTDIEGIVKISGLLTAVLSIRSKISLASWLCLSLDEIMSDYWPKKLVEKETTFIEKIEFLITTRKWVTKKQVFHYDEELVLEESFEAFVKVDDIQTIKK